MVEFGDPEKAAAQGPVGPPPFPKPGVSNVLQEPISRAELPQDYRFPELILDLNRRYDFLAASAINCLLRGAGRAVEQCWAETSSEELFRQTIGTEVRFEPCQASEALIKAFVLNRRLRVGGISAEMEELVANAIRVCKDDLQLERIFLVMLDLPSRSWLGALSEQFAGRKDTKTDCLMTSYLAHMARQHSAAIAKPASAILRRLCSEDSSRFGSPKAQLALGAIPAASLDSFFAERLSYSAGQFSVEDERQESLNLARCLSDDAYRLVERYGLVGLCAGARLLRSAPDAMLPIEVSSARKTIEFESLRESSPEPVAELGRRLMEVIRLRGRVDRELGFKLLNGSGIESKLLAAQVFAQLGKNSFDPAFIESFPSESAWVLAVALGNQASPFPRSWGSNEKLVLAYAAGRNISGVEDLYVFYLNNKGMMPWKFLELSAKSREQPVECEFLPRLEELWRVGNAERSRYKRERLVLNIGMYGLFGLIVTPLIASPIMHPDAQGLAALRILGASLCVGFALFGAKWWAHRSVKAKHDL